MQCWCRLGDENMIVLVGESASGKSTIEKIRLAIPLALADG